MHTAEVIISEVQGQGRWSCLSRAVWCAPPICCSIEGYLVAQPESKGRRGDASKPPSVRISLEEPTKALPERAVPARKVVRFAQAGLLYVTSAAPAVSKGHIQGAGDHRAHGLGRASVAVGCIWSRPPDTCKLF